MPEEEAELVKEPGVTSVWGGCAAAVEVARASIGGGAIVGDGCEVTRDPRSELGRDPMAEGGAKEGERETEEGEEDKVTEEDWGILHVPMADRCGRLIWFRWR